MPLYRDFSDENAVILVWKYDEEESLDIEELLEPENREKVREYHPQKLKEALMVRKILHSIKPGFKILYRDKEPYLFPQEAEISITHSFPFAALAISPHKIGIDLERFNSKIVRLQDKFLQEEERDFIPAGQEEQYLTVIWSLKESLYKIHHSNYWSLKKHYEVKPFDFKNLRQVKCRVHDDHFSDEFKARVEFFDQYCFTIVD